jgi:hypothetical protein
MKKSVLLFGAIAGAIVSGMLIATTATSQPIDFEGSELSGYVIMVLAFSVIFFAIKNYRDKHLSGSISFAKAFLMGLYITLVASTIYVATWLVLSETYAQGYMDQYYAYTIDKLKASDLPQEEIDIKIQEMEDFKIMYKNPAVKIGVTYIEILPVGLFISLISAGFLRKKTL